MNKKKALYILIIMACLVLIIGPYALHFYLYGIDYTLTLPGGYYLARVTGSDMEIIAPKPIEDHDSKGVLVITSSIIESNVIGYYVCDKIVTGYAVLPEHLWDQDEVKRSPGYFILDTMSGQAEKGLSEGAWLYELKEYGIPSQPELKFPGRFDNWFGLNKCESGLL